MGGTGGGPKQSGRFTAVELKVLAFMEGTALDGLGPKGKF